MKTENIQEITEKKYSPPTILDISENWNIEKANPIYSKIKSRDELLIDLPHHWQSEKGWEQYTGAGEYTKDIEVNIKENERVFIRFDAIFYKYSLFINDYLYAKDEGYFTPLICEITDEAIKNTKIKIRVLVESYDEENLRNKKYITGIFGHWDAHEPHFNPGGIWQKVYLLKTRSVKINKTLVTLKKHTLTKKSNHSVTNFLFNLDSQYDGEALFRLSLIPENFDGKSFSFEKNVLIKSGENISISFDHNFDNAALWYPFDIGFPHVYKVKVEVFINNIISDTNEFTFGFRSLNWKNWQLSVNGKKTYLKGINVGPLRFRMAYVDYEEWENEFIILQKLNCNMIRVHCHVQIREFYELADKYGIMIFQDFPLQWMYSRAAAQPAIKQIKEMVTLLYNNPSIVLWSCHNEPYYVGKPENLDKTNITNVWEFLVYNYDKVILDRKLRYHVKKIDKTRFVNRASCIYSIVGFKGTDIHAYWGWYFADMTLFNTIRRFAKRNMRFVSEFGTQSIPNYENAIKFMPEKLSDIDWEELKINYNCQSRLLHHHIPIAENDNLETYIKKTQDYQVKFTRYYIDLLRLIKNKPNKGILTFMYRSSYPGIDWSVIDYWGGRKKVFTTVRRGFQKIYPFIFINSNNKVRKKKNNISIYVVNDFPDSKKKIKFYLRIKSGREIIVNDDIDLIIAPNSTAVKIKNIKLDFSIINKDIKILLIAKDGLKLYKNRYIIKIDNEKSDK